MIRGRFWIVASSVSPLQALVGKMCRAGDLLAGSSITILEQIGAAV
jgi:hypothetical protein